MLPLLVCLLFTGALAELDDWDQFNLIWQDEFDFFDGNKWDHEITAWGGGNQEFQVYTPDNDNTYVRDGILYLKPTLLKDNTNPQTGQPFGEEFLRSGTMNLYDLYGRCTNNNNGGCVRYGWNRDIPPIASSRIRTAGKFSFRYGRAVIRAKMPVGDWMWPAMWLLPENWEYGGWPRSGEMDIVETIANRDLRWRDSNRFAGTQHMGSTLHWGVHPAENRYYLTGAGRDDVNRNYGDHFHEYIMDWGESGITFYVDGQQVVRIPQTPIPNPGWNGFYEYGKPWNRPNPGWQTWMAPFDKHFHFLLNVAVGGCNGFIPDDSRASNRGGAFPKPWRNSDGYKEGMNNFWNARDQWYWTWDPTEGENAAMQVDYIRVYTAQNK